MSDVVVASSTPTRVCTTVVAGWLEKLAIYGIVYSILSNSEFFKLGLG